MAKDIYDYLKKPTKKEFKNDKFIDDFFGIPKLNIPKCFLFSSAKDYLINNSINNYNDDVLMIKIYYVYAKKHMKLYNKKSKEEYNFLARKFYEQTIKQMYSVYDKSLHIINYVYDLNIEADINFKINIKKELKEKDSKIYKRVKSIFSRLYDDKYVIRDDATHNGSCLFFR